MDFSDNIFCHRSFYLGLFIILELINMVGATSIFDRIKEEKFDMRYKPILDSHGKAYRKLRKLTTITKCFKLRIILKD